MSEYTQVRINRGRLVGGSPFEPRTKDARGELLTYKNGAKSGQPKLSFNVGIAVPKAEAAAVIQQLEAIAAAGFPTLFAGGQKPAKFSYKYVDGDSTAPNESNKIPSQQEGYPGHFVFWFNNDKAPQCYVWGDWVNELMGSGIKRGDYIALVGSAKPNGDTTRPGIYLNLEKVALVEEGPEIMGARQSAEEAFTGAAPAAPAAAQMPVPAAQLPAAGVPAAQLPAPVVPGVPAAPGAGVTQPHTGILGGQTAAPGVPAAPAPPVAPAVPKRMVQGVAYEESALVAGGYTPEQIASLPLA
jgi:hypothetical protein